RRGEPAFTQARARFRAEPRALERKKAAPEAEARRLATERDEVAATVGSDALELFRRVAKLRGVAVAAARDGMCQLCHVVLRLQMYSELKRNDAIVQCPQCSRILYYEAPVPTVSREP